MTPNDDPNAPPTALEQTSAETQQNMQRATWLAENQAAIFAYNQRVLETGVFSDGLRSF